jgi:hypothetical protein
LAKFAAGVVDTVGKFAAGVVDTGGNFSAGVVDTGGNLPPVSKKFKTVLMGYSGAGGKLIHEKKSRDTVLLSKDRQLSSAPPPKMLLQLNAEAVAAILFFLSFYL